MFEVCLGLGELAVAILVGFVVVWFVREIFSRYMAYRDEEALYDEAFAWIEEYRAKLKDNNRYPVGENMFSQAFTEYNPKTCHRVWVRLVKEGHFTSDPLDGEWIVRKG